MLDLILVLLLGLPLRIWFRDRARGIGGFCSVFIILLYFYFSFFSLVPNVIGHEFP